MLFPRGRADGARSGGAAMIVAAMGADDLTGIIVAVLVGLYLIYVLIKREKL
jgi:hypothetical protein